MMARKPKDGPPADKASLPARASDWGQLSPEMRALPNDAWRTFCLWLVQNPAGRGGTSYGRYADAARAAGFGQNSNAANLGKLAWKMAHDDRMIAALAVETRRVLRAAYPEAVNAALRIIRDPEHKDHARLVSQFVDRADPVTVKQDIQVTHRVVDPDQEALEELRALRHLGVTRDVMIQTFGGNGLARLERLEAVDNARRASEARIIDGEYSEVPANG